MDLIGQGCDLPRTLFSDERTQPQVKSFCLYDLVRGAVRVRGWQLPAGGLRYRSRSTERNIRPRHRQPPLPPRPPQTIRSLCRFPP